MTRHEQLLTSTGVFVGVVLGCGSFWLASARGDPGAPHTAVASENPEAGKGGDAGVDPAMVANANLVQSLYECSRQLTGVTDDDAKLEQQLNAEHLANRDTEGAAEARRIARRELSPRDWARLARSGTVKYVLPCASFNPPPEILDQLGLAPRDVPMIHEAFAAARDTAWAQIRPLCVAAAGNAESADKLGLEACPQLILDTETGANPRDADGAVRAVASLRAGLVDPSAVPMGDPAVTTFLTMTQIAKNAELRIAVQLGADDARAIVYGRNSCSHVVEFSGPGPEAVR
jgi:hypothetical protein